ncbi:aspartyl protease family protein [Mucilaginibacter sp. X5P1]|uniref:aspartyl protease family protein n=1 Tax=Mucilaginibacter sp. X5P1 TaxID=2723088 RepID=UPI00160C09C0|nr:aspartyl protease family protein [Mucilaginibacter sp. X5P1]MBB6141186.1 putative aspartyl protease [Mucilaginibacter sp. X5P1]
MKFSVPLHIIDLHEDGFHPLLDITVFGRLFKVVLDTGASKTAFDKTLLLKANEIALLNASDKLSTGLGTNTMESFTATIYDMHIGDLKIPGFDVAVLDLSAINIAYEQMGHPEVLGVIGGDILMQYKAVIDYGKQVVKFKT